MASIPGLKPQPVVISGRWGPGKGTLYQRLQLAHQGTFAATVSHTTRKPRPGEVEGTSYYYVSREKLEASVAEDAFNEFTEFNGDLYGMSKQTVIDQTAKVLIVLLDIEMKWVKQLKEARLKAGSQTHPRFVFIKPPGFIALEGGDLGTGAQKTRPVFKDSWPKQEPSSTLPKQGCATR